MASVSPFLRDSHFFPQGYNELDPAKDTFHLNTLFGSNSGATIIDALDTLYLMDMTDELADAREWVRVLRLTQLGLAARAVASPRGSPRPNVTSGGVVNVAVRAARASIRYR
jgi:hypothetical protein